jgi:26S proteasome regulatory subunit N2
LYISPSSENLSEDESFSERQLASLVAAKVFYHLEDLDDARKHALGAADLFDVSDTSEFVETLVANFIDEYIRLRREQYEGNGDVQIDPRLESVVERMFDRCFEHQRYDHAMGIALEARRLDVVEKAVAATPGKAEVLAHIYTLAQTVIDNREFRAEVLRILVKLYRELAQPDYLNMCQCWLFLDDANSIAVTLDKLVRSSDTDDYLMAYQVAFDLNENQNRPFLMRVIGDIKAPAAADPAAPPSAQDDLDAEVADRIKQLKAILSGEMPINMYLHFLYGHNASDLNILKNIKEKLEVRNTVTHNALIMAQAIMNAGTTVDTFWRDNVEWVGQAQNWAKFTATASCGVIHKGHIDQSLKVLEPYLPKPGVEGSPYQEGGALYALGLIHCGHGQDKTDYLVSALESAASNDIKQHGACLGLGLSAMATGNQALYERLRDVVFLDNAVAGEAASLAIGLVMLGTANGEALQEMIAYAHETKHEKIIRGIAMGVALMVYGREEAADTLIEQLLRDKDPILRYGGMYAIALAYVGSSNNSAIRKLLHVAVSDVSDDVRRAAVTSLGFVLCNQPEQVPRIVSLLAESFNPHVRYGSCMAVGIACAGTGHQEALELLEPLLKDKVDYVRQSAMIAISMVLIQHNKKKEPKAAVVRQAFNDAIGRRGDSMTKLGAILGAGIIDAGGRNVTISLLSPGGHKKMAAIVGMAIFNQFWYWYPLTHFISLSFTPTAVIGLNAALKMPADFEFVSNAPPSLYAYPPPIPVKKKEERKAVPTAQLSVSAKAKAKADKKEKASGAKDTDMADADNKDTDKNKDKADTDADTEMASADADADATDGSKSEKKQNDDAQSCVLKNPARVTWAQQSVVSASADQRYTPVKKQLAGIVMLRDSRPNEEENFVEPTPPKIGVPGVSDDEPAPPEEFDFSG